ncbi:MAG TPA: NDP-sugar synthase [Pyrinomonadaceae bacterium]|nr:NDP-sugar synthase [Pyrinomonadaceae bacterium]
MQALILAGGKGTRLRPLTVYTPKPIVPILNRPLLRYQIEMLARAAITDITLSLSYLPDKIEDVVGDGSDLGVNLRFVTEPSPMGTAGAYKFAAGSIRETTVVFNGDIITDVDVAGVIETHRANAAEATILLTPVDDPTKYGLVESGEKGEVVAFLEKPSADAVSKLKTKNINAGLYILEPGILELIPTGENCSFEYDVFPRVIKGGRKFFGHVLKTEYWRDVGTPDSYLSAHHDFLAGKIKQFSPAETAASDLATTAEVDGVSIIGEGCVIKPHARITNSVLGPGVHVDERATIANSVIWAHTRIGTAADIDGAVVGRSCYLGRNCSVRPGAVLGDKTSLPDYSKT